MKRTYRKLISIEDNPTLLSELNQSAIVLQQQPTLSEYLNRVMSEKQLSAPEVYHRAEIDRQMYNRLIQVGQNQRARRRTLLQISIGLLSSEKEARELLATCGYVFELSSVEDQAFLFCIRNGLYDMYNVYEAMAYISKSSGNSTSAKEF